MIKQRVSDGKYKENTQARPRVKGSPKAYGMTRSGFDIVLGLECIQQRGGTPNNVQEMEENISCMSFSF